MLTSDGGYNHLRLKKLKVSAASCKLCYRMDHLILKESWKEEWSLDRYQLQFSFEPHIWDPPASTDHHDFSDSGQGQNISSLWVSLMDLRPWEMPQNYFGGMPENLMQPEGSP